MRRPYGPEREKLIMQHGQRVYRGNLKPSLVIRSVAMRSSAAMLTTIPGQVDEEVFRLNR